MLIYLYHSPEQAHGGAMDDLIPVHVSSSCAARHKSRGSLDTVVELSAGGRRD